MTLANRITILRIILIPIFIITLLQQQYPWPAVIFTFTILTDALDGFIARWRRQATRLGSFLDPMADKLLMFSSFLTAAYLKMIPLWVFVIILSRDLLIVLGWTITYLITGSTEVKPRLFGKLTTIFQMITIWLILLAIPSPVTDKLLLATVVVTAVSGFDYILEGSRKLNRHA
ncbi:MAG: CDP-alcohol phosphatidyltransferase family protein [Endomicrobiales bacterium]